MFRRKVETVLKNYYDNPDEKIIIVEGARQIGKSYIIRETASKLFKNYIEIDLKSDYEGVKRFANVNSAYSFYLVLGTLYGNKIGSLNDTIVFLDEIQYYPNLITLLKDLKKDNLYRYIASGSLLGITLKHIFIPMGSINEIKMFPMDFEEFLWARNVSKNVIEYLKECFEKHNTIDESVHSTILSYFKEYLICGGLPEAVNHFINKNVFKVRETHNLIYEYYKDDCSRYDFQQKLKISRVYDLLSSNMGNKVKRIVFKDIENKNEMGLNNYLDEIDYMLASGITNINRAISNPVFPLNESISKKLIKLYYNDVGLLSNLLYEKNIDAILNQDKGINLGSIYETAAAMELVAHGHKLFYFDNKKVGEVDFLINSFNDLNVIPIEIKSGKDQNNFRAIPKLVGPNGNYKLPHGYVFGNKNVFKLENNLIILPIYLIMFL